MDSNVISAAMPTPALSGRQAPLLLASARACVAPDPQVQGTAVPIAGSFVSAATRTHSADLLTPPRGAPV